MKYTGPLPENILKRMSPEDRAPLRKAGKTISEIEAKYPDQAERELQIQIADFLRMRDIPFNRNRMDKKSTGTVGWPDFTFPFKGFFYGIEVKVGSNSTTLEQERCLAMITANGGIAFVVRSLEELRAILK